MVAPSLSADKIERILIVKEHDLNTLGWLLDFRWKSTEGWLNVKCASEEFNEMKIFFSFYNTFGMRLAFTKPLMTLMTLPTLLVYIQAVALNTQGLYI